jgi:predicted O-methyltransferase YrrM
VSGNSFTDRLLSRVARPVIALLQKQAQELARQRQMIDERHQKQQALLLELQQTVASTAEAASRSHTELHKLREEVAALKRASDDVRHGIGRRGLAGQTRRIGHDVRALLRRELLPGDQLPFPQRLFVHRANITSQNEEDGILLTLLREAGIGDARFLDIGSGMGGGAVAMLAQECGWRGLMVDGNADHVKLARPRFPEGRISVVHAFVTRDNVNDLVARHGLAGDIDVFSLDIDGNDYWIWEALRACSPRIVAVEYNAFFGLARAVTVPYDAAFDRHNLPPLLSRNYFGASLPAFVRLGRRKGYRLVTTDASGLNAFFLRHDVAAHIPECPVDQLPYRETDAGKYDDVLAAAAEMGVPLVDVE